MIALKTFEPNLKGRDFVIGDLHGSRLAFENLLKNLSFDETVDRMFSVGDLVDRGEDSHWCLSLIRNSWFHSVYANHEQLMYEAFSGEPYGIWWLDNGGSWGLSARLVADTLRAGGTPAITDEEYDIIDLQALVQELPMMMTVNMKDGKKFHILHAELPMDLSYKITDEILADPQKVFEIGSTLCHEGYSMLWSRNIFGRFYDQTLHDHAKLVRTVKYFEKRLPFNDELSHIISGHTPCQKPLTVIGQTVIDTKAYATHKTAARGAVGRWEALTCVQLDTWQFYQSTPNTFMTTNPIVINRADLNALGQP